MKLLFAPIAIAFSGVLFILIVLAEVFAQALKLMGYGIDEPSNE